ncbi:MAG: HD domain-containing protein [Betaproteobacteria bacterium]|nr:MAG: HD domain-containing protein [Betaproteobacteria bacterium]
MNAPARPAGFTTANPHALATILEASQTKRIIASRDIFDLSGTKLWARDLPVSQALQRKLLDRQLRQPLETCLLAEDGVTSHSLVESTKTLLDRVTPLTILLRPYADKLVREVGHLPLHSVVQLLLTAGQASRPESFDHAVQAMVLNGAMVMAHGGDTQALRVAMVCGLLHDLGEMYIDPQFGEADADRALDLQSYQQLVVHPHVGQLLITQLTDYPSVIARAISEHHERLDGSGYPLRLQREQVSPQGRLLAVTEATLNVLRADTPQLSRASVSLRVVPGEFDLQWVGLIAHAAQAQPELHATLATDEIQARLAGLDAALHAAHASARDLMDDAESAGLKDALTLAQHLLSRLRTGWNASGLWSKESVTANTAAEIEAVEDELVFRLRAIQRAALLHAGKLPLGDAQRLNQLCDHLVVC